MRWLIAALLLLLTVRVGLAQKLELQPRLSLDPDGHTAMVYRVLFTPDNQRLISIAADRTARIWNLKTGQTERVIDFPFDHRESSGLLIAMALSPDGKTLAIGGYGVLRGGKYVSPVYLFEMSTYKLKDVLLKDNEDTIWSLSFSCDGKYLAGMLSPGGDKHSKIAVWNYPSGTLHADLEFDPQRKLPRSINGWDVAFHPVEKPIVAGAYSDGAIRLWDITKPKVKPVEFKGHAPGDTCLAWSPDKGASLATGGKDGKICFWNADHDDPIRILQGVGNGVSSLAFTPQGKLLISRGDGNKPKSFAPSLLDPKTAKERSFDTPARTHNDPTFGAISADGRLAATTGDDNHNIYIWDTTTFKRLRTLGGVGRAQRLVGWHKAENLIAWRSEPLTDGANGRDLSGGIFSLTEMDWAKTPPSGGYVTGRFAKDDIKLAADADVNGVRVFRNGKKSSLLEMPWFDPMKSFTLVPGEKPRAAAAGGRSVYLFDLDAPGATIKPSRVFEAHTADVESVTASPDGRYLLTASRDQTLRLFAVAGVLKETFAGIGVEVADAKPGLRVGRVLPGSPAEKAGIQKDDVILAVAEDGQALVPIGGVDTDQLRGKDGSTIQLRVLRPNAKPQESTIKLTRRKVEFDWPRVQPLLSFFFTDQEWIAWTPEGYYACSPLGERLMGWLLDQGPTQLPIYFPAERFHASLYRPDVLRRVLKTGSVAEAVAEANAAKWPTERKKLTEVSKVLPPQIQGFHIDGERKALLEVIRGSTDWKETRLQLIVDGERIDREPKTISRNEKSWQVGWDLSDLKGERQIRVVATTPVSDAYSDTIKFQTGSGPAPLGKLRVLCIGVGKNQHGSDLPSAGEDAKVVEAAFAANWKGLYSGYKAKVLIDEEATRANILAALNDVAAVQQEGDTFLLYVSGHAVKDKKDGEYYLVSNDCDKDSPDLNGVPGTQLKTKLAAMKGRRLVFLDTCHAGQFVDLLPALEPARTQLIVVCACRGTERSWAKCPEPKLNQGLFAYHLVRVLSGTVVAESPVSIATLQNHLEPLVRKSSQMFKNESNKETEQNPYFYVPQDMPPRADILLTAPKK